MALGCQGQRFDPADGVRRQNSVKVREELAATRSFPPQGGAECFSLDRQDDEAVLTCAMLDRKSVV